jgi:hypothetical protein
MRSRSAKSRVVGIAGRRVDTNLSGISGPYDPEIAAAAEVEQLAGRLWSSFNIPLVWHLDGLSDVTGTHSRLGLRSVNEAGQLAGDVSVCWFDSHCSVVMYLGYPLLLSHRGASG